ncbi:MAG: hypothetical protein DMG23_12670 [Acidobacteria bacterium]|nr:MAG: hypothetical protein DMG23_12670 [Acidobacteriota bacterium]
MTNSGHQNFVAVSSVVGIDITQEHIRLARERVGNLAQVLRGDGTNIPFEDASFDYVYSHGVLHRVDQRRRMVEEIFRVLRPGGRFNVQVYAAWSYSHFRHLQKFGRDWKRHVENSTAPVHIELYTARKLRALFPGIPLRIRKYEFHHWQFLGRWLGFFIAATGTKSNCRNDGSASKAMQLVV